MKTSRRALLGASCIGVMGAFGCTKAPAPESSPAPSREPSPSLTPTPTPTPTSTLPPDPLPEGVVNAMVFGTDAREKTSLGGRSDALLIAQISADRSKLTLVSIARDTQAHIRGRGAPEKINHSFAYGGTPLLRETVSNLLHGLPIHMTAQVNFNMFINVTRWLGGIRVNNRNASKVTVNKTRRLVTFPAGDILLENTDALIYARQRKGLPLGDMDRAERHRALITGMLRGLKEVAIQRPNEFGPLAENVIKNVKVTEFDPARVGDLRTPLLSLDLDNITSLMVPLTGYATVNKASVGILNKPRAKELAEALKAGDVSGYVAKYGTGYRP